LLLRSPAQGITRPERSSAKDGAVGGVEVGAGPARHCILGCALHQGRGERPLSAAGVVDGLPAFVPRLRSGRPRA
jgi:hypothetical protein